MARKKIKNSKKVTLPVLHPDAADAFYETTLATIMECARINRLSKTRRFQEK